MTSFAHTCCRCGRIVAVAATSPIRMGFVPKFWLGPTIIFIALFYQTHGFCSSNSCTNKKRGAQHLVQSSFQMSTGELFNVGMNAVETRGQAQGGLSSLTTSARGKFYPNIQPLQKKDTAIVWFSGSDLRVHDHGGLIAASTARACVPVFIFDPEELAKKSRHTVASIHSAVQALSESLQKLGTPLLTRIGKPEAVLRDLMAQTQTTHLIYHEDPAAPEVAATAQAAVTAAGGAAAAAWRQHLLPEPWAGLGSLPTNFGEFLRGVDGLRRVQPAAPDDLPPPLPPLPAGVEPGPLPALEEVCPGWAEGPWERDTLYGLLSPRDVTEAGALRLLEEYVALGDTAYGDRHLLDLSDWAGEPGLERAATLRIVAARGTPGLAPGEALTRTLALPLALGCISPKQLALCRAGRGLGAQRPLTCWARELAVREEWHSLLAARDLADEAAGDGAMGEGVEIKYKRWNGWLTRYSVGGKEDGPALVLVHGFGASLEQWRGLHDQLQGDHRIYAIDMLGFGHSAKPAFSYSQYSWANQVADFCREVVQGDFIIAGNSIGGFIASSVAAELRGRCRGLCLVNSAGRVLPAETYAAEVARQGGTVLARTQEGRLGPYRAPPNLVLGGFAAGLFYFLQGRIEKTCENLYPTNPSVVKQGLARAIFRDSCDPGATGVIAAGGKLPAPRPLNELFAEFGGPVLAVQGVLDPLNDARGRADALEALGAKVVRIDAGHCPHDEQPALVAGPLREFAAKQLGGGSSSSSRPDATETAKAPTGQESEIIREEAAEEKAKEPTEAELLQKELDDLEKQLSALEVKAKEAADNVLESGKTGYMRAAADVDNYKRALAKDLDQVKKTSMAGALTGFMPILDRFEEVYGAFDPAATPEGEAKLYGSYNALYGQLTLGFEKLGMTQYRAEVGEAYSALRHEKTQEVESEAKKGTVVEALAPGMELGGTIIRPARVVVSAGMPEPPNAEEEDLEVSQEAATEGEESEESDISSSGEKEGVVGEEKEGGKGKKKRRGKKTKRRRE